MVERDKLGGRCLNYACIPAKAVLRSADLLTEMREGDEFGIKAASIEIDYAAIQARRDKVVQHAHLRRWRAVPQTRGRGPRGLRSAAAGRSVSVGGESYGAQGVVLATGSLPRPIPGTSSAGG